MVMFVKSFSKNKQSGFVSIIVAIIMMTIITLLIVAYSLISRREQRLALDKRLSAQAYFAAETGVNKARYLIQSGSLSSNIDACGSAQLPTIDLDNNIKTTCVLVDQTPESITFDSVTAQKAKVTKLLTADNSNIRKIEIYWQSNDTPGTFASLLSQFPASASYSALKASLVNIPGSFTREIINQNNTYTGYLNPIGVSALTGASSTLSFVSSNQGEIVKGECVAGSSPKECKAIINIPSTVNTPSLYLILSSIYADASVVIKAYKDVGAELVLVRLTGSQAIIDSTGMSSDVLRRVQARVPLSSSWEVDNFAVSSDSLDYDICKLYKHNLASGVISDDGMCPRSF